ncbi:MAG: cell division protein ZapB [Treponema sp.]|nr:cell division protein ZapB [Treponema sp.]
MVSLEQVKLLESKVSRTIEYVKKVTAENSQLKERLDSYQKRIGELEVLIQRFKDEQSRIEEGILSALTRLNQFEDALDTTAQKESPSLEEAASAPSPLEEDDEAPLELLEDEDEEKEDGELDIF